MIMKKVPEAKPSISSVVKVKTQCSDYPNCKENKYCTKCDTKICLKCTSET